MQQFQFKILPLTMMKEDNSPIDIKKIRDICMTGLDDCPPEDRCIAWLLLSNVFPKNPEKWVEYREKMVNTYKNLIKIFKLEGYEDKIIPNTTLHYTFQLDDSQLMDLIHIDMVRTAHHLIFLPYPDYSVTNLDQKDYLLPYHAHMRRIERILYMFAKMNSTLSYLQGFNELITVIFYVMLSALVYFGNDWLEVEAFSYYIFQEIFSTTRLIDLFSLQDQLDLINDRLDSFMKILERHLPKAYKVIKNLGIHPLCFVFKWLNLLFAQDHLMPNLLLIWDDLFSHFEDILVFEYYIAVANISLVEKDLDPNNYSSTLSVLQKTEINDIKLLLRIANQFWKQDHGEG